MQPHRPLQSIADDALLLRLTELTQQSRRVEAHLLVHIAEVDARRLYAREASPSMFAYATEQLHLSEAEACLRIAAARASREHPALLAMLGDGRLHLSAIALLAPHLTLANRDEVLRKAAHRSKRQIEELVAELSPQPDATAQIRKLPERFVSHKAAVATQPVAPVSGAAVAASISAGDGCPNGHFRLDEAATADQPRPSGVNAPIELRLDGVEAAAEPCPVRAVDAASPARAATIEPLSPARYKVQFTASATLREKLERLRALMRTSVPDGDLAAIVEAAVTEKLQRLGARRFGTARKPRKTLAQSDTSASASRHIPRGEASGARARREPLPLRGRGGPALHAARPSRVPSPPPARIRGNPRAGEHRPAMPSAQRLPGGDRLRRAPASAGPRRAFSGALRRDGMPSASHNGER